MLQKPEQTFVITPGAREDAGSFFGAGFGPVPILFGQVERFAGDAGVRVRMVAVYFHIAAGHGVELNGVP